MCHIFPARRMVPEHPPVWNGNLTYVVLKTKLLCELDSEMMLCINMRSALPPPYLAGVCVNSIWKVILILSEWKTSEWGLCKGISKSTSSKVMKSQPQSISVFAEDISASPSCQGYQDMSHLQAGFGWLHRMTAPSHLNILGFPWPISTFSYSGCRFSLGSSDALIPKLVSLMAVSL